MGGVGCGRPSLRRTPATVVVATVVITTRSLGTRGPVGVRSPTSPTPLGAMSAGWPPVARRPRLPLGTRNLVLRIAGRTGQRSGKLARINGETLNFDVEKPLELFEPE